MRFDARPCQPLVSGASPLHIPDSVLARQPKIATDEFSNPGRDRLFGPSRSHQARAPRSNRNPTEGVGPPQRFFENIREFGFVLPKRPSNASVSFLHLGQSTVAA